MASVKSNGAQIFYEESGAGDALILIPGLGAHSGIWGPFPKMFAERRRVITYDPRGLGRSAGGTNKLSIGLMTSDAKAVLDAAGIQKAALLATSMGALVALRFALDYPARTSKLVLITPAVFRTRYGEWLLDTLQLFRERFSPEEFVRAFVLLAFAPPFFEKGYGMIKEVSRMLTPTPAEYEQIGRQLECLKDADFSSEISRIEAPTLIIAGQHDILAPIEGARKFASKIRRSRLVSIPDAGHSPFVEATEEVVKAIDEFL